MADQKIEKGSKVNIIKGKGQGQTGTVFWWGESKYGDGMRAGVAGDDGQKYWVDEDDLALAEPAEAAQAASAPPPVAEGNHLAGAKIVLTGDFDAYERKEATAILERLGADVTGSVSGKTMVVIAGKKAGQKKLSQAEQRGLPVLGEPQLLALMGGQTLEQVLAGQAEPTPAAGAAPEAKPALPMPFAAPRPWNGIYRTVFEGTDQVEVEGEYKNGLKHGSWKAYWPSGQLKEDYAWEHGRKHGPELDWAENGTQLCDGRNEHGRRVGTWTWHHANGKPANAYHYDDQARRQGEYVWDLPDGSPRARGFWLDDKKHGSWTWWQEGQWEKLERGLHRDIFHGPEQAWFPGGVLAFRRAWHHGERHGLEETFDQQGRPRFRGEWNHGLPVGEHVNWDDEGQKTRVQHSDGLPAALLADEKKREKILKKIKKAKDNYAKDDALRDNLEYGQQGPYVYHLWKAGHLDVAADPDLHEHMRDAAGLMSGEELVDFLKKAKAGGHGSTFQKWSDDLDRLTMEVYARDPAPVDAAAGSLPKNAALGVALVRARFGQPPDPVLPKDGLKALVKKHVDDYGIGPRVLWLDDEGQIAEQDLFLGYAGEPAPLFGRFIELFGGFEAWIQALKPHAFKEAKEDVARVSFSTFREVVRLAAPDEVARLITGISLDNDTHDKIHQALTAWRKDDVDTTVRIALDVDDDGLRKWPAVCTALIRLAEAGREPPAELLAALRLDAESPTSSSAWYTDPLRGLAEDQKNDPAQHLRLVPIRVGCAVPRAALFHRALAGLSDEAARAVIERQLDSEYHKTAVAQFLYRVDNPALWERASAIIEADSYGHQDRSMYGLGDLGAKGLPLLEAGLKRAKKKDQQEGWHKALLVALARTLVDEGGFDPAYDKHVRFDCIKDDYYYRFYTPFMERLLYGLPTERAEAILLAGLDSKHFARAFVYLGACPTKKVLELAFTRLLALEDKFKYEQVQAVGLGLSTLPNPRDWVKWIKQSGGGGGLAESFRSALGHQALEALDRELAEGGTEQAPVLDQIEKLRRRAAEAGGAGQRIYLLRPREERAEGLNLIGGAAPGVGADRWPRMDDEPMAHLFTLDVASMPGLEGQVPAGTRAVSVFCAHPDNNEAYEYDNAYTAVIFTTAEQLAAGGESPEDLEEEIGAGSFEVVPVDLDPAVFHDADGELRGEIYRACARVGGPPLWLQDDEGGAAGFLMQFDEGFVPMNLGDSGVMYVYTDGAFWQCY